jgi:hypothetical protein
VEIADLSGCDHADADARRSSAACIGEEEREARGTTPKCRTDSDRDNDRNRVELYEAARGSCSQSAGHSR